MGACGMRKKRQRPPLSQSPKLPRCPPPRQRRGKAEIQRLQQARGRGVLEHGWRHDPQAPARRARARSEDFGEGGDPQ
eukprot:9053458-Pyramimonas_sp.AAC.1